MMVLFSVATLTMLLGTAELPQLSRPIITSAGDSIGGCVAPPSGVGGTGAGAWACFLAAGAP